jgi:hypothetical protein
MGFGMHSKVTPAIAQSRRQLVCTFYHMMEPMLDFQAVRDRKMTMAELANGLTVDDLRRQTNEMIDNVQDLIKDCTDADVVFEPIDPDAKDDFASSDAEKGIAWNLAHLVVHTTASSEESAFLAAEMARGVPNHGRSRYETPWETVTTIAQCRDRLEESRRMRLATLDVWPAQPHTGIAFEPWPGAGERNCFSQFLGGMSHEHSHLAQIAEVVRQAKAVRS